MTATHMRKFIVHIGAHNAFVTLRVEALCVECARELVARLYPAATKPGDIEIDVIDDSDKG
jgi:hypothetical protein